MPDHTRLQVVLTFPDGQVISFSTVMWDLSRPEDLESIGPVVVTFQKRDPRSLPRDVVLTREVQ